MGVPQKPSSNHPSWEWNKKGQNEKPKRGKKAKGGKKGQKAKKGQKGRRPKRAKRIKRPKRGKKSKKGKQSHHKQISQSLMDEQIVQPSMNGGTQYFCLLKRPKMEKNTIINKLVNH